MHYKKKDELYTITGTQLNDLERKVKKNNQRGNQNYRKPYYNRQHRGPTNNFSQSRQNNNFNRNNNY